MKSLTILAAVLLLGGASFAQQPKAKTVTKKTHKTTVKPPVKKKKVLPSAPVPASGSAIVNPVDAPPTVAPSPAPKKIYGVDEALEKAPAFSGGYPGLRQYLSNNLKYPVEAQDADIEGKVIISFTVCEDGSLCDEKIVKSVGGGCDEEAMRVIKKMPKWEPGIKDGKPVKVRYMLPVVFQFQD